MNIIIKASVVSLVVLFVSGCGKTSGYFAGKDNSEQPAKLNRLKNEIKIRRVWEKDTGGGVGELTLRLSPAIEGNRVYSADYKGRITAIDIKRGRRLWTVHLKKPVSSGPTVSNGKLAVGTSQGEVLLLNAKTGKLEWKNRVSSEVLSAPAIGNGVVVVRSIDGVITALHEKTGGKMWRYKRRAPVLTIRGSSAPVIANGRIYAGFDNGKVACISPQNGRILWERSITVVRGRTELERLVDIDTDPVINNGILYIAGYQGKLAAVDVKEAQLLWTQSTSSTKSLAVDEKHVYVTDEHSQIWAYDRVTGVSVWKQGTMRARKLTGPVVFGNYIVAGDYQGYLHWLDKFSGRVVARYRADSKGYIEAPRVANKTLIALGRSGDLTALKVIYK